MKFSIAPLLLYFFCILLFPACDPASKHENKQAADTVSTAVTEVVLPPPYATKSTAKYAKVLGWPEGKKPKAPEGFDVIKFASGLYNPRNIYIAENGDIFVAESNTESKGVKKAYEKVIGRAASLNLGESANRITLLRDTNKDGKADEQHIFLAGLNRPYGMLILQNSFYVANMNGIWKYPYAPGQNFIKDTGVRIIDLPAGGYNHHWTRNILPNKDNSKIFVSVGSASNVGEGGMEDEQRRANILEINPDGTGEKIYASGLRNPVGMSLAPGSDVLWTVVNERDELGDDLVPDYLTQVKEHGFYGWPYSYYGQHTDPRITGNDQRPDLVKKALVPDVALGAHTASLGLAFYKGNSFPEKYRNGAFIGQHGSWNRSSLAGYKVIFVPFKNGRPAGMPEDFLTGFIVSEEEVYGRPVGIAVTKEGDLLVADDTANTVWLVRRKK